VKAAGVKFMTMKAYAKRMPQATKESRTPSATLFLAEFVGTPRQPWLRKSLRLTPRLPRGFPKSREHRFSRATADFSDVAGP
jgi:hypothetical protein